MAVKILKAEAASHANALQNFVAEIDIMRACRDNNIVGFVGAWNNEVGALSLRVCPESVCSIFVDEDLHHSLPARCLSTSCLRRGCVDAAVSALSDSLVSRTPSV